MDENINSENSVPHTSSYMDPSTSSSSSLANVPGTSGLEPTYQLPPTDQKEKLEEKIDELQKLIETTNKMINYESICQVVNELPTSEIKDILSITNIEYPEMQDIRECLLDKLIGIKTLIPLTQRIMKVYSTKQQQPPVPLDNSTTMQLPRNQLLNSSDPGPFMGLKSLTDLHENLLSFQSVESYLTLDQKSQFEHFPFYKKRETLMSPVYVRTKHNFPTFFDCKYYFSQTARDSVKNSWDIKKKEFKVQVVLRFVKGVKFFLVNNELNYVGQRHATERLPYNLSVFVNYLRLKLPKTNIATNPNTFRWQCNIPLDITQQTETYNSVKVLWINEPSSFLLGIYLVEKMTSEELLEELKTKPLRKSEITKKQIKHFMVNAKDMHVFMMYLSLQDPLSKTRMELPARGVNCKHLQCFEAKQYIQMNENKQIWACPLCKKKVKFEDIEIDEFILNILQSPKVGEECKNVALFPDGSWSTDTVHESSNNFVSNRKQSKTSYKNEVLNISDSDDEDTQSAKRTKYNPPQESETKNIAETDDQKNLEDNIVVNSNVAVSVSDSDDGPEPISSTSVNEPQN